MLRNFRKQESLLAIRLKISFSFPRTEEKINDTSLLDVFIISPEAGVRLFDVISYGYNEKVTNQAAKWKMTEGQIAGDQDADL